MSTTMRSVQHDEANRQACHVVLATHVAGQSDRYVNVDCETLAAAHVAAVSEIAVPWRDIDAVARRLGAYVQAHDIGPLCLCIDMHDQPFVGLERVSPPPPLGVSFEPVALRETEPALVALLESGVADTDGEHAVGIAKTRNFFQRFGPRSSSDIMLLISWLLLAFFWSTTGVSTNLLFFSPLLLFMIVTLIPLNQSWYLVPGGVIQRRGGVFGVLRFTPADTVLIVTPINGARHAVLTCERGTYRLSLTAVELQALLAAWTSPVKPPTESQLAAWQ